MTTSAWQVWRSLRHKSSCTFRQSLRLWIRWLRHRSWTWTETSSFVIILGHGQSPILSNNPLHKLDVTTRLQIWNLERRMCETMYSSTDWVRWWCWCSFFYHRLCPAMAMVHVSVFHCRLHLTFPWRVLKRLHKFPHYESMKRKLIQNLYIYIWQSLASYTFSTGNLGPFFCT